MNAPIFVPPGQIHPYQARVWNDRSRLVVIRKSRRIGMSWALLGRAVDRAIGPSKTKTYYLSHTYDSGLEAMADVEWWADRFDAGYRAMHGRSIWLGGSKAKGLSKETAKFASGGQFKVLSAKPRKVRGITGAPDYIIDEHAFHLEPEEMLNAARPILMRPLGTVTVLSTVMFEDVFWRFCEETIENIAKDRNEGRRPDHSFHQVTFDDALDDGFMEREAWVVADAVASGIATPDKLIHVQDPRFARHLEGIVGAERMAEVEGHSLYRPHARLEYRERVWRLVAEPDRELQCIPSRSGTQYMTKELIRRAVDADDCYVFRFEATSSFLDLGPAIRDTAVVEWMEGPGRVLTSLRSNPGRKWYYGVDFGRSRDLTVISFGYLEGEVMKVVFMLELDNVPFAQQRLFFDQVVARVDVVAGGALDKGAGGADLAEHARVALGEHRAENIQLSNDWYQQHMPKMKKRFQEGTIRVPDDRFVESDLLQIKLVDGVPKVPRGERVNVGKALDGKASKFRHGDGAVSLVLLNYAARNAAANSSGYGHLNVGLPPNRRQRGLG